MIPTPTFWTERLVFAAANGEKQDLEVIKDLYSDPVTLAFASGTPPLPPTNKSAEGHAKWAASCILAVNICLPKSPEEPRVPGQVIGFMNLGNMSPPPSQMTYFGIFFKSAEFQDKGYGTEAITWLLEQAFQRFNLHKVRGETWGWNTRARAFYKKLGFREEGVLREHRWQEGAWQDEIALGILASEWRAAQELAKAAVA